MIQPINNINFKAVRLVHNSKFSESQKNVAKDIQAKLGEKGEKRDFVIEPLENDVVELSEVYNVKEKGVGIDKYIEYSNPLLIGRYNEAYPFNCGDYLDKIKELNKDIIKFIVTSVAAIGFICLGGFLMTPKSNKVIKQSENIVTTVKDFVKNVTKDSLKLFR